MIDAPPAAPSPTGGVMIGGHELCHVYVRLAIELWTASLRKPPTDGQDGTGISREPQDIGIPDGIRFIIIRNFGTINHFAQRSNKNFSPRPSVDCHDMVDRDAERLCVGRPRGRRSTAIPSIGGCNRWTPLRWSIRQNGSILVRVSRSQGDFVAACIKG